LRSINNAIRHHLFASTTGMLCFNLGTRNPELGATFEHSAEHRLSLKESQNYYRNAKEGI